MNIVINGLNILDMKMIRMFGLMNIGEKFDDDWRKCIIKLFKSRIDEAFEDVMEE